jgi:HK97 family phage portal protein
VASDLQTRAIKAAIGNLKPAGSGGSKALASTQPLAFTAPGQPLYFDLGLNGETMQAYKRSIYVMRCVDTIASVIAGLPFRAGMDPTMPGQTDPLCKLATLLGPTTPQAPGGPNPTTDSATFWRWQIIQYVVNGRMAMETQRTGNRTSEIVSLWPLVSKALLPKPTGAGSQEWFDGFIYRTPQGDLSYRNDQIAYFWRPSPEDWRQPISVLQAAMDIVDVQVSLDRYQANLIKRGMVGATMVTHPRFADADQKRAWEEQFLQLFTGVNNAGRTIFTEADAPAGAKISDAIQVTPLAVNAVDGKTVEINQQAKIDITIALGVPMSLIGNASQRTYANADSEFRNFWTITLLPLIRELESQINTILAPTLGREVGWFDLSEVAALRPANPITPPTVADLIEYGIENPQEIGALLGLQPGAAAIDTATVGKGTSPADTSTVGVGIESSHIGASTPAAAGGARSELPGVQLARELIRRSQAIDVRSEERHDYSSFGKGKNWVTKAGGLPLPIRDVAHAMVRKGHDESSAIANAVAIAKIFASGRNPGGGRVHADTAAKYAAAVAEFEAKAKASHGSKRQDMGVTESDPGIQALLPKIGEPGSLSKPKKPHLFQGSDLDHCDACGQPITAEIHRAALQAKSGFHTNPDTKLRASKFTSVKHLLGASTAHLANVDAVAGPMEQTLTDLFTRQERETLARFNGKRGAQMRRRAAPPPPDASGAAQIPPSAAAIYDQGHWTGQTAVALTPSYSAAAGLAATTVHGQLGHPTIEVNNSIAAAKDYITSRANQTSPQITATIYDQIQQALAKGVVAGDSREKLATAIQNVFGMARTRARTIAQTEAISGLNGAAYAYASTLPPDVVGSKVWLSHHDQRTRPSHVEVDRQERAVNMPFTVGPPTDPPVPMMHPGEPSAPANLTIGCRCGVAYMPPGVSTKIIEMATQANAAHLAALKAGATYEAAQAVGDAVVAGGE